jgi:hypothetical protein
VEQTGTNQTPDSPPSEDQARVWGKAVEGLRSEVVEGLLYAHDRVNADSTKVLEATAFLYAAIELLAERGLLSVAELDQRKQTVMERLVKVFLQRGMGVIMLEPEADKYTYPDVAEVDCSARLHLCKAACCKLSFALSQQDVQEGILRWELGDPYMARKESDGYCHHIDRCTLFCAVRERRPIPCRAYTCKNDKRIWQDFDGMVPVPDLETAFMDKVPGRAVAKLGKPRRREGIPMIEIEDGKSSQET